MIRMPDRITVRRHRARARAHATAKFAHVHVHSRVYTLHGATPIQRKEGKRNATAREGGSEELARAEREGDTPTNATSCRSRV